MLHDLFQSRNHRQSDKRELRNLHSQFGEKIIDILQTRAKDKSLSTRDKKHWRRLLRKAKSLH